MSQLITQEGLDKLKAELKQIVEVDLPLNIHARNQAREEGDLKENAAYQTAIKVIDELSSRQQEIEDILKDYQLVSVQKGKSNKSGKVQFGSKVKIKYLDLGTELEIEIVGISESDATLGKFSNESPVVQAILDKKVGTITKVKTPQGQFQIEIKEII